jgi:purine-binding chemotaxis protein CheW
MASPPEGTRVCVFELSGESYGLPLESLREIVPMAALSRQPSMPSILEGILNLRGTAVPVLRVAQVLGLPQDALELHTPLLIMRGEPLALLVARVTGIVAFSEGLVPLTGSDSFNGCIEGRLTTAAGAVYLLSPERLLLEKERRIVAGFRDTENLRLHQIERES